jgi:hypothetical protein
VTIAALPLSVIVATGSIAKRLGDLFAHFAYSVLLLALAAQSLLAHITPIARFFLAP